jgi:hypothetical protein
MLKYRLLGIVCLFFSLSAVAQFPATKGGDVYTDSIANSDIVSVTLCRDERQNTPPIIALRGDARLLLSFDYLGDEPISPVYRILHCDPDWRLSDLFPSDYLVGFEENLFPAPKRSLGTAQNYQHYTLQLPNADVKLRLAGNYILQVRDAYHGGALLFQRQFALLDERVMLTLDQREVVGVRRLSHQQVWAHLDVQRIGRLLDTRDVRLFVQQGWNNGQWQELPMYRWESSTQLLYGGQDTALFSGGDEWHVLDLQTLRTASEGVRSIVYRDDAYQVEVLPDKFSVPGRIRDHATSRSDLDGWCVMGYTTDRINPSGLKYFPIECEYAWVYFTLNGPVGQQVALEIGDRSFPLRYNLERNAYEVSVYLKQGVYSYRYVCNGVNAEGVSAETRNDYWGLVYYRERGARYWQLIKVANSVANFKL